MTETERIIASVLLKIGAVFLRPDKPFTWASGIKSPIYCDNRLILSWPEERHTVEHALAALIKDNWPQCELVIGTSTAGIGHAALSSAILGLPMGYVRASAKDHGRENRIEGRALPGQKTVVVEDLISTAGSVCQVVEILREESVNVIGVASIFTYDMKKGLDRLAQTGVKNISLTNLDALLEVAADEGYISADDIARIKKFRDNPSDESWMK